MASDLISLLLRVNLALAGAVLLILVLRGPIRRHFGARAAYTAWLIAPLAAVAVLLPARTVVVMIPNPVPVAAAKVEAPRPPAELAAPVAAEPSVKAAQRVRQRNDRLRDSLVAGWAIIALLALGVQAERQRRFLKSLGRLDGDPRGDIFHAQHPGVGPAVIGAIDPCVVLPADFAERFTPEEQALILAHERTHLRGGDAQINALVTTIQCLCWFNPLVHLGAKLVRIDQEIACDAAVLTHHPVARRTYGEAMLKTQLAPYAPPMGCHWPASANKQLKERFVMLSQHRAGRARRLIGSAAVAVVALGAGYAAWAAQPARIVHRDEAARAERQVTGRAVLAALGEGDARKVRDLLAKAANREPDDTPLMAAVRRGDMGAVRALVKSGADVDESTSDGSPLIIAARAGRGDMVNLLLGAGADASKSTPGDGTPLTNAVRGGDVAIVTDLLKNGADANASTSDGTPLTLAARSGRADLIKLLIDNGADSGKRSRGDGDPLINAVRSGDAKAVRALIAAGADVNQATLGDGSPLISAARSGQVEMVKLLLDNGADAEVAVRGDGNPLIMAAARGNLDMVRLLVDHGASIEAFVPGDETPLINAAQSGDMATVRYLVEKGADVNRAVPANGGTRSPLGEAIKRGHPAVADYLKSKGARGS